MKRTTIHRIVIMLYIFNILFLGFNAEQVNANLVFQENDSLNLQRYDGNIFYVGGIGPYNYSTIQEAVNDSSDGDTVFVYDDSSPYQENILTIDKPITLIGENKYTTVINLYRSYSGEGAIRIQKWVEGVTIRGFTIQNGYAGITCTANYTTITDNIIQHNWWGLTLNQGHHNVVCNNIIRWNFAEDMGFDYNYFQRVSGIMVCAFTQSTNNHHLYNNTVYENFAGIYIGEGTEVYYEGETYNITINDNNVSNNQAFGIWFEEVANNQVINNTITQNEEGIRIIQKSPNNVFSYNTITGNILGMKIGGIDTESNLISNNVISQSEIGILYDFAQHNLVRENLLDDNDIGMEFIFDSNENTIIKNTIQNSNTYGVYIPNAVADHPSQSIDNTIIHNIFINNGEQARDFWWNFWDGGYPIGGNYWDDYTGRDRNSDGFGDTPYSIPPRANEDKFPLMSPSIPLIGITIQRKLWFGLYVQITLFESLEIETIDWSIQFHDGFILFPANRIAEGSFPTPLLFEPKTVFTPVFGFGRVQINVTANTVSKDAKGFVFGPFILGVNDI